MSISLPFSVRFHTRTWALSLMVLSRLICSAQTAPNQPPAADLTAPALRAHAKLPQYFRSGGPLEQDLIQARAEAISRGIPWKGLSFFVNDAENLGGFTPVAARDLYQKLTCRVDAIFVGHVQASASHVSDWGTVYTDYAAAADAVLKDNQKSSIREKAVIVLTRLGGSAMVNGDPVAFSFRGYPELKPGLKYLQFLRFLPDSASYQPLDAYSTLIASGKDWVVARTGSAVALPELTQGELEAAIASWLSSCANERHGLSEGDMSPVCFLLWHS